MKILYAIQGTGNGHISRSQELIVQFQKYGPVDILISGNQWQVKLSQTITYQKYGLFYISSVTGGINFWASLQAAQPLQFIRDIRDFPIYNYDLILNDCEPITAWAGKRAKKKVVGISNQVSFFSPRIPRPKHKQSFIEAVIKYYAPCTYKIGFHYEAYDSFITTPIIRQLLRQAPIQNNGTIVVYLPAYNYRSIVSLLRAVQDVSFILYTSQTSHSYTIDNIQIHPISSEAYTQNIIQCYGIISAAGFQATAEALFLGKKLLVIPQFHQYEQWVNAAALELLGVTVLPSIQKDFALHVKKWLNTALCIQKQYPDNAAFLAETIINAYG